MSVEEHVGSLAEELASLQQLQAQAQAMGNHAALVQLSQRGLRLQDQQRTLQTVSKTNTNLQSRVTEVETQVHEVKQQINDLQQDVASKLEALKQESQAKMQQLHVLLEQMQAVQVQTVSAPAPSMAAPCEAEAQSSAESEHFQPFLRDPVFMEEEEEAPLLLQNKGFLQGDVAAVLQQTASWPALLGLSGDHPKIVDVEAKALDVEVERIIERVSTVPMQCSVVRVDMLVCITVHMPPTRLAICAI